MDRKLNSWSTLAKIVARRTYNRVDNGHTESWEETIERAIAGNVKGHNVSEMEITMLRYYALNRKAMCAGRGLWFSGAPSHNRIGGAALCNCWFTIGDDWTNLVLAQDLLMLGGGVGMSVEHRFVSKLPTVKKNVVVLHKPTKDADFIVPDSREGWNELTYRVLESFFVTGKSFTYSTVCIRDYGSEIMGFGGKASGASPLITCIEKICAILIARAGKKVKPVTVSDLLCCIGEMVVSGNVRRSAILILGDPWDKEYLKAKRWDLNPLPSYRAMANFTVVCDDIDDLHPAYWETYEVGEAFGIFNRANAQKYGRMGEEVPDTCIGVNPCGEATLDDGEPCNLQEIFLPNVEGIDEFVTAAELMHRWGKRVTSEKYHNAKSAAIVKKNRRIGTSITGCLQSPLYKADILDHVYNELRKQNKHYSAELGIPPSIRTTVVKPSGTLSLVGDCTPGIHPAFSRYYIRRVRFAANDPLIPILRKAKYNAEPVQRLDGSLDHSTLVVDFYRETPAGTPCADEGFDTWKQFDALLLAQKHWADQSVSVTVYYQRDEIAQIKHWLSDNLRNIKTISFLCRSEHGFAQAPLEAIPETEYSKLAAAVKEISFDEIVDGELENMECDGGVCTIK